MGGGVCLLWDKLPLPLPALLLGTSWHCQLPLPASLQYQSQCWQCVAPPSDPPPPPPHTHTSPSHPPPIPLPLLQVADFNLSKALDLNPHASTAVSTNPRQAAALPASGS